MKSDEILHRSVEVSAIREEKREVDFVASDESVDSHDSVIRQNWRLGRWTKNAPILWATAPPHGEVRRGGREPVR